jgi:Eph receptor B1
MPALILLEHCENGALDAYLHKTRGTHMMMRLSFVADVASALSYLSSRRIVHRDVAARNVLLDAAMVCKLSDFGMAVALPTGGAKTEDGQYLQNYVRLRGHQPVRWAAVEVLNDARCVNLLSYQDCACSSTLT